MSSSSQLLLSQLSLSAEEIEAIRELPLSDAEDELLGYLRKTDFPLSELLQDYVGVTVYEQSTLGYPRLLLRVDAALRGLLARAEQDEGWAPAVRMSAHLLMRVRDRVESELGGGGDGGGSDVHLPSPSLVRSLPVPTDSLAWTEDRWSFASPPSLPAWARTTADQEAYLARLKTPFAPDAASNPLEKFLHAREQRVTLVVNSGQSDNYYRVVKDHTKFTVALDTPLVNVTRLQLSSVKFSASPYRVSAVFGGNMILLEPKVKGLARHAEDRFRVTLQISPGTYRDGASEIVAALNESLRRNVAGPGGSHAFLDWGDAPETTFSYDATSQKVIMRLALGMQFHQDAFELHWVRPEVANYLGFTTAVGAARDVYLPGALRARTRRSKLGSSRDASTLVVTHTSVVVRYFMVPSSLPSSSSSSSVRAWLLEPKTAEAEAAATAFVRSVKLLPETGSYSYNSLLERMRATLAQDEVFGRYSYVTEIADHANPNEAVLALGLVPDPAHASLRGWWHRPACAGRTVLVVDFPSEDAAVWTAEGAHGCQFATLGASISDNYIRSAPCVVEADAAYSSEDPIFVPSMRPVKTEAAATGPLQKITEDGGGDFFVFDPVTGEVYGGASPSPREVVAGLYLRVRDEFRASFHRLDTVVALPRSQNDTAISLIGATHQLLRSVQRMRTQNSEVGFDEYQRVRFLVDIAYESNVFASATLRSPPAPANFGANNLNVFAHIMTRRAADETGTSLISVSAGSATTGSVGSVFTVDTKDDFGLPAETSAKFVLGRLELTLAPVTDASLSYDSQGVEAMVLFEDWVTVYDSVSALVAAVNYRLNTATYSGFGAVLSGGSKLEALYPYRSGNNQRMLYAARLTLRASKVVSEDMFELRLLDTALWRDRMGFDAATTPPFVFALNEPARKHVGSSGLVRAAVVADTPLRSSVAPLRLSSPNAAAATAVMAARLCVRGRVSADSGSGAFAFAPDVHGLDAAAPAENAYELELWLDAGRDLSVSAIVESFNAQIERAAAATEENGRYAPLLRWHNDKVNRFVWLEALYTQRFDGSDFNLVTYSPQQFSECVRRRGMVSAGYLFSLGHVLGFHSQIEYDLSWRRAPTETTTSGFVVELTGDAPAVAAETRHEYYLSVEDSCLSRQHTVVVRTSPPVEKEEGGVNSSGAMSASAWVTRSARAAAAANGVDCVGGLSDASAAGLELDLTFAGGSSANSLTLRQLYAASVALGAATNRKRKRVELATRISAGYDEYVFAKDGRRAGDVGAETVVASNGLASNLSVQNNLMTTFSLAVNQTSTFEVMFSEPNSNLAMRYYAGPVKLSTLQITLTDMYGAPAPITAPWTLEFTAFCLPSSSSAAVVDAAGSQTQSPPG